MHACDHDLAEPAWLLSLPPAMCRYLADGGGAPGGPAAFCACDPPGRPLGSGGGTAHLLAEAWKATGGGMPFDAWLHARRRMVMHGGGQSRRLPAYAAVGKLFIPVPAYRWSMGQRMDQTLFDLQRPFVEQVAAQAGPSARLVIASGDVLLRTEDDIPPLPDADVVMLGLWARPEVAQHFGVLFCHRHDPSRLDFFLQKPSTDKVRELATGHLFMIDAGVWLLSAKAVMCLMDRCGWNSAQARFAGEHTAVYDLYAQWGPLFGDTPVVQDPGMSGLTCAVAPVPRGAFYHFGTSQDVMDSAWELQNLVVDQTRFGRVGSAPHPRLFLQNADFRYSPGQDVNHNLWVENAMVPASWSLASHHVITGVPDNDWNVTLEEGICLDMAPVDDDDFVVRPYGIGDPFRGALSDAATVWMGRPFGQWLEARGLSVAAAGLSPETCIQEACIFPVLAREALTGDFVNWMCTAAPPDDAASRACWLQARRLSAAGLAQTVNLRRLYAGQQQRMRTALLAMAANYRRSMFYRLDLEQVATLLGKGTDGLAFPEPVAQDAAVVRMHERMLRARVTALRGDTVAAATLEQEAFGALRDAIVTPVMADAVRPRCAVLADQIVWGRSPARLDLAGGWTDTPPYCLECGGAVLNMAVLLNGQPPVQVFARLIEEKALVIRSIDLGLSETLTCYADVAAYNVPTSGFAVARAAFALAGFDPRFNGGSWGSLKAQLTAFGGGIEVSMLAAIPKGSGLGTSSILAATLLGTLADLTALGWDRIEIARRTLALEQMLTSGGGWQDQVGGLFHGVKLVQTLPGLSQVPQVRWAPSSFFNTPAIRRRLLLYYTGITRMARSILSEIVRGIFLNSHERLEIIGQIGRNAHAMYEAILRHDADGVAEGVRRSWQLNQRLDRGTSVPEVDAIITDYGADLAAVKLLGAGGGGFLFMMATDEAAADRIREQLNRQPPNPRARFVELSISEDGLQITRS